MPPAGRTGPRFRQAPNPFTCGGPGLSARICVFGAGAIGGYLAARLAGAGHEVCCVARGTHLAAMQSGGLRLIEAQRETCVDLDCTESAAELGRQDFVFVTLKTNALPAAAAGIAGLLGPATTIVTAQNGVPWWYFFGAAPPQGEPHLVSVDPGGRLWHALGPHRAVGAVIYPSAEIVRPGVVRHVFGDRIALGEPDGGHSDRLAEVVRLLRESGLSAEATDNIRGELWLKLSVNAALNPLSLIRGTPIANILEDDVDRLYLTRLIREAQHVARSLGIAPLMSAEELVESLHRFGEHKTSMLTDYERGRPLELEALTGAVLEIADRMQTPVTELRDLWARVSSLPVPNRWSTGPDDAE
ncbi:MAG: ketopantoate reductase family protein [Gammaproteobacteria bacterium]